MAKKQDKESAGADAGGERFEDALDEIETLVERIESGELGLEDAIAAYERGAGLVKRCRSMLDRAEQRIEELDRSLSPDANRAGGGDEPIGQGPGR